MLTLGLAGTASAQTACDVTVSPGESIQTDGVDQASPGDTVCVEAGEYAESVEITTENITLTSVDRHGAVITFEPSPAAFTPTVDVQADDVTIESFVVERVATDASSAERGVQVTGATGVTLYDLKVQGDDNGLDVDDFIGVLMHDNKGHTEATVDQIRAEGFTAGIVTMSFATNDVEAHIENSRALFNDHGFVAMETDGASPLTSVTGVDNEFKVNNDENILLSEDNGQLFGWDTQAANDDAIAFDGEIRVEEGDSVQTAIDVAAQGAMVKLWPGTYEENVVVDVPGLHLNSKDNLQATITYDPGADTSERTIDVRADDVTVTRLTIERVADENDTSAIRALQTTGTSGVTVSGNYVVGVTNGDTPENFAGILVHENQGDTTNVTLKDNTVEGFQHGIAVLGYTSNVVEASLVDNTAQSNTHGLTVLERDGQSPQIGPITGSANDFTGNSQESIRLSEDGETLMGWDMQSVDTDLIQLDGPILVEDGDSLQTANDVAAAGATVNVGAGTYEESLLVDVPDLNLVGEDGAEIVLDPATASDNGDRALTLAADGAVVENIDVERIVTAANSWVRAVQFAHDQSDAGADSQAELRDLDVTITGDAGELNGTAAAIVVSNWLDSSFAVQATLTNVEAVSDSTEGAAVVVNSHGPEVSATIQDSVLTDSHRGVLVLPDGEATVEDTDLGGNDIGVENDNGTAVATENWWGATSGPFHADKNPDGEGSEALGDVAFDPWWANADMTILGTTDGIVENLDQSTSYFSIQDAIDNAGTGDTLEVASGTHEERVDIDVDGLTLTAETDHEATITWTPGSATWKPTVNIDADDVTVEGLTIERISADNRDWSTGSFARAVEVSGTSGAEVVDNVIVGTPSDDNPPRFSGIQVVNSGPVEDILLQDNQIEGFYTGIVVRGWDGSDTIRDIQLERNDISGSVHGLVAMQEDSAQQPEDVNGVGNDFTGNAAESIVLSPTSGVLGFDTWSFNVDEIALEGPVLVEEGDSLRTALDVAAEDATIELLPGTYEQALDVDVEGVTLTASQAHEATVTHAPATATGTPTLNVLAENVTVEDLRVERSAADDRTATSSHAQALAVRTANATVQDNVIVGDLDTDNAFDRFDGIMVIDNEDAHDVELLDNHVEGFFAGIVVTSAYGGTTVEDVEVTANTATGNEHGFVAKYHDAGAFAGTQPENIFGTDNAFTANAAENIYISAGGTFQGYDVADFDAREVSFAVQTVEVGDDLNMVLGAAPYGGILELEPGTHVATEGVVLDKPTTLTSTAGAEVTTLTFSEDSGTPTVSVEADAVRILDLSIERGDSSAAIAQAVRVSSSNVLLEDLALDKAGSGAHDQGISVLDAYAGQADPVPTEDVSIQDVTVTGFDTGIGIATQSSADVGLTGVTVEDSTVEDNTYGIGLAVAGSTVSPDQVRVEDSEILDNQHGVYLFAESEDAFFTDDVTGDVTLRNNIFVGNDGSGVTNLDGATVDARENYWGATNGPDTDDNPLPATGDAIEGEADFMAWCTDRGCYEYGLPASLLDSDPFCSNGDCTGLDDEETVTVSTSLVPTQDLARGESDGEKTSVECTSVRGYPGQHGFEAGVVSTPDDENVYDASICLVEAFGHQQTPLVTITVLGGTLTATTE